MCIIKRFVNKKNIYLLFLVIITLIGIILIPTYAKFSESYVTEEDIVGINLSYDINISNIEEFEEITVKSGEKEIFNVNITNNIGELAYYGIWYKMVNPAEMPEDGTIQIGKLDTSTVETSGSIDNDESLTTSIVIINDSASTLKIYVGVSTSTTSTSDIEYLNGKSLITGELMGYLYLRTVAPGSYVSYTGGNGSTGSNVSAGYCSSSTARYSYSGWRVAYTDSNNAYLITGGAPECMSGTSNSYKVDNVAANNPTSTTETWTLSSSMGGWWGGSSTSNYYHGSSYTFNSSTGSYTLSGNTLQITSSNVSSNYANYPYTCKQTSASTGCTTIYKVTNYTAGSGVMWGGSSATLTASSYTAGNVTDYDLPSSFITRLNTAATAYCNANFASGGTCNSNSVWALNSTDYGNITEKEFEIAKKQLRRSIESVEENSALLNSLIGSSLLDKDKEYLANYDNILKILGGHIYETN